MILVIGGFGAGKREYVRRELGYADADIAEGVLDSRPVVYALHEIIRKGLTVDDGVLQTLAEKEVIICDEVGCGVVPIEREAREYRETVGRLCAELAARAEKVVRVYCGIPTVIKG